MSFDIGTPILPSDVLGLAVNSGTVDAGVLTLNLENGTSSVAISLNYQPSDIALMLGSPGAAGQVVGSDGTTVRWVDSSITSHTQSGVMSNLSVVTLPANAMLLGMQIVETAAHSLSIMIGTSAGAQDLMGPTAVAASQLLTISPLSLTAVSFQSQQQVFVNSASWNSASLNVRVWYVL